MWKKIVGWGGWGGLFSIVVLALIIGGVWYFDSKDNSQSDTTPTPTPISEEEKIQQENYEKEMSDYCSRPAVSLTGVDLFRCRDYANYGTDSSVSSLDELLNRKLDLPAFCDRKIAEMKGVEIADCFDEQPLDENE